MSSLLVVVVVVVVAVLFLAPQGEDLQKSTSEKMESIELQQNKGTKVLTRRCAVGCSTIQVSTAQRQRPCLK